MDANDIEIAQLLLGNPTADLANHGVILGGAKKKEEQAKIF